MHAGQETRLGAVFIADPGDDFLIEQRRTNGALRPGVQAAQGLLAVPVGVENIRTEVRDALMVLVGGIDVHEAQLVADDLYIARGVGQLQHDAGGMPRLAPAIACVVDGPSALHLEVGVHDGLVELHE